MPKEFGWPTGRLFAGAAVVAIAGCTALVTPRPQVSASPFASAVASTSNAVPTPGPSVDSQRAWRLATIPSPPGHPAYEVLGASPDGGTVLFRDTNAYTALYVEHDGLASVVADSSTGSGGVLAGRLSPSGKFVVFDDGTALRRYDIGSGQTADVMLVSDPIAGIEWYVFTSEDAMAVVTALADTPVHPTQLLALDLTTSTATPLGDRTDVGIVYPTDRGIVVQVDLSATHDNHSHVALYLVAPDGSDSLLYDAGEAGYLTIAQDGYRVAISRGEGGRAGSYIVDLLQGTKLQLTGGGMVESFSPDGTQVELRLTDGSAEVSAIDGTRTGTLPDASRTAWVWR